MSAFLLAVQFLTTVPLKIKNFSQKNIGWAMVYFPVVGLLLGIMLLGINALLSICNFPLLTTSIFLVVALIIITAGMHLDGLSDTVDAFLSAKPKDEMLVIMRDPHVGVMGVLSLISVILLKISLFYSIEAPLKATAFLLSCVLSRWSGVLAIFLFAYARKEGKAKEFFEAMNLKVFVLSAIIAFILAFLIWRVKGLFALLIIAGCTYLSGKISTRKLGGITGDTIGATVELTEIITLFTVCIC